MCGVLNPVLIYDIIWYHIELYNTSIMYIIQRIPKQYTVSNEYWIDLPLHPLRRLGSEFHIFFSHVAPSPAGNFSSWCPSVVNKQRPRFCSSPGRRYRPFGGCRIDTCGTDPPFVAGCRAIKLLRFQGHPTSYMALDPWIYWRWHFFSLTIWSLLVSNLSAAKWLFQSCEYVW